MRRDGVVDLDEYLGRYREVGFQNNYGYLWRLCWGEVIWGNDESGGDSFGEKREKGVWKLRLSMKYEVDIE